MLGWRCILGASAVLIGLGSTAKAAGSYDNPTMGDTPCVVLKSYQAIADGTDSYGAEATVANVCGRSVEVAFCFPFVAPGEDTEPHCTSGLLRPWATSRVEVSDLPAQLATPDYQWRWLGHPTDSDR